MISKKICMVGRFAVGKTSLVDRFVKNHFAENLNSIIHVRLMDAIFGSYKLKSYILGKKFKFSGQKYSNIELII